MDSRKLLPPGAAHKILGVSRSTLYRWSQDGTIPAIKINGQWRYRPSDLEKMLEDGKNSFFDFEDVAEEEYWG